MDHPLSIWLGASGRITRFAYAAAANIRDFETMLEQDK
jgi:hypothetical protein